MACVVAPDDQLYVWNPAGALSVTVLPLHKVTTPAVAVILEVSTGFAGGVLIVAVTGTRLLSHVLIVVTDT